MKAYIIARLLLMLTVIFWVAVAYINYLLFW